MNLSNPRRLLKLATSLVRQPRDLPDYCRYHTLRGRLPAEVGLPWWSFAAIREVKKYCTGREEVFEFGSGGSTIFLSALCRRITAVEDDVAWGARMRDELDRRELRNVEVHLHPFDFQRPVGFAESDYLRAVSRQRYDIIVVDGQDWTYDVRPQCFARAEEQIRPGGLIVVDDSWRYPQLRERHRARRVQQCEGVGPCRTGVTSTDLFFY